MSLQRFCLRWDNLQSNLFSVFYEFLRHGYFVDVTLEVEGGFLQAHKMVLSACSPYFRALLLDYPDKHAIVMLKDILYCDMRSLLDLMYRGEVSVDEDRLTALLKVAEFLKMKELIEVKKEKRNLSSSLLSAVQPSMVTTHTPRLPHLRRIHQTSSSYKRNIPMTSTSSTTASDLLGLAPKRKHGRLSSDRTLTTTPVLDSVTHSRHQIAMDGDRGVEDSLKLSIGDSLVAQGSPEVKMCGLEFHRSPSFHSVRATRLSDRKNESGIGPTVSSAIEAKTPNENKENVEEINTVTSTRRYRAWSIYLSLTKGRCFITGKVNSELIEKSRNILHCKRLNMHSLIRTDGTKYELVGNPVHTTKVPVWVQTKFQLGFPDDWLETILLWKEQVGTGTASLDFTTSSTPLSSADSEYRARSDQSKCRSTNRALPQVHLTDIVLTDWTPVLDEMHCLKVQGYVQSNSIGEKVFHTTATVVAWKRSGTDQFCHCIGNKYRLQGPLVDLKNAVPSAVHKLLNTHSPLSLKEILKEWKDAITTGKVMSTPKCSRLYNTDEDNLLGHSSTLDFTPGKAVDFSSVMSKLRPSCSPVSTVGGTPPTRHISLMMSDTMKGTQEDSPLWRQQSRKEVNKFIKKQQKVNRRRGVVRKTKAVRKLPTPQAAWTDINCAFRINKDISLGDNSSFESFHV
ncbi:uncharacterized protein [Periplaneta americana]|uniref:uncharacterized protein n=1 Tax=Periplaneta americana TaxID=6978 RepID=UPI0037E7FDCD